MSKLLICLLYGLSAVTYNLISKYLISTLKLAPFFFLSCQHCLTLSYTFLFGPRLSFSHFNPILPMTLFSLGNLSLSLIGMRYTNLPMYVCIRKLTTMIIFLMDLFSQSKLSAVGVFFITFGGVFAGINDVSGSFFGYFVVFLSVLMNVGQLVWAKRLNEKGFDPVYVFLYTSCVSLPISCGISVMGEEELSMVPEKISSLRIFSLVIIGAASSVLANLMTIVCSARVSPIGTSVTGNVKDGVSTFLGFLLFQELVTERFVQGILMSTAGALVFSYSKLVNFKDLKKPS